MPIPIPLDYWRPNVSVEYEIPWITPRSIYTLLPFVTKDKTVLEFGAGGSTLFFAKRVRSVLSFETNKYWFDKITTICKEKGYNNVELNLWGEDAQESIVAFLKGEWDIILVDSRPEKCRESIMAASVRLVRAGGCIVLDNYTGVDLRNVYGLSEFRVAFYNEFQWSGKGTAIFWKQSVEKKHE